MTPEFNFNFALIWMPPSANLFLFISENIFSIFIFLFFSCVFRQHRTRNLTFYKKKYSSQVLETAEVDMYQHCTYLLSSPFILFLGKSNLNSYLIYLFMYFVGRPGGYASRISSLKHSKNDLFAKG